MSYLDVNVLRNFTRKLAAALPPRNERRAPLFDVNSGAESPGSAARPATATMGGSVTGSVTPFVDSSNLDVSAPGAGVSSGTMPPTQKMPSSPPVPMPDATADDIVVDSKPDAAPASPGAAETAAAPGVLNTMMQYASDPTTLWTVGGGLGAMGLANLLRSKDDEDDGPGILGNLLYGAGGAAAGYGVSKYLWPLIMQLLAQRNAQGGGTPNPTLPSTATGAPDVGLSNPAVVGGNTVPNSRGMQINPEPMPEMNMPPSPTMG